MRVALLSGMLAVLAGTVSAQQPRRLTLRPQDAVADAEFTAVASVRELRDGSVLVADHGSAGLVLVRWGSSDVTSIGRSGRGPGEFQGVGWLYPLAGDSTLFTDSFLGRWLLLDGPRIVATVSEQHAVNRLLGGYLSGADERGRVLGAHRSVLSGRAQATGGTADSIALLLVERASERVDTVALLRDRDRRGFHVGQPKGGRPAVIVVTNPLTTEEVALLFRDGWIAVARIGPYRVDWRTPDGRWIRGAPLPFAEVRVNDREKCLAMDRVIGRAGGPGPCDPSSLPGWPEIMPPFQPARLQRLAPPLLEAPDGRLVIARTPSVANPQRRYDIVDRTGGLAGVLSVGANETLIGFGARSVFTLVTADIGEQTLRRHPWP